MKRIYYFCIILVVAVIGICFSSIKPKALTYNYTTPLLYESYTLTNGEGFSYIINSEFPREAFALCLRDGNVAAYLLDIHYSGNNLVLDIYNRQGSVETQVNLTSLSNSNLYYMQLLFDYDLEEMYLYISPIIFNLQNRQDDSPIISNVGLSSNGIMFEITDNLLISNYTSSQSSVAINLYYSAYPNDVLIGFQQLYMFNIVNQFSQDIEEQLDFVWTDLSSTIPLSYYNSLINSCYYTGYNAGYDLGYLTGKNDGFNLGWNDGYDDGYEDGYDDGMHATSESVWQAGFAAGYHDGVSSTTAYQEGFYDGEQEGYTQGYQDSEDGITATHKFWGVLTDIAGGLNKILALQLGPGITIGTLVFIPLFFATLGLILWIWRRN